MKGKNAILFFLIIALIAGLTVVSITGVKIGSFEVKPVREQIKLGLDIKGGVVVVYEAVTDEKGDELRRVMNQTKQVMGNRINELGLTEPLITIEGERRLRIELPGVENAEQAIQAIGRVAKLEFLLVEADQSTAKEGANKQDFKHSLVLDGGEVQDAYVTRGEMGQIQVGLRFKSEGTDAFFEATKKAANLDHSNGQIAIVLDSTVISAPYVQNAIPGGRAVINGNFTFEDADKLASLIRGGALPIALNEVQTSTVGPTLGIDSLNSAVKAAFIGLIAVALIMIIAFRFPGFVASVTLTLYALLIVYVMIALRATLTLPGIAGIVISLGMAVDANVIIFDRIREELSNDKSIRASINSAFSRGMTTIIDSNATTFIAAVILFFFGEGPIRGFAITLMIGIIGSMLTAVLVTRTLLKLSLGITSNPAMYGGKK